MGPEDLRAGLVGYSIQIRKVRQVNSHFFVLKIDNYFFYVFLNKKRRIKRSILKRNQDV